MLKIIVEYLTNLWYPNIRIVKNKGVNIKMQEVTMRNFYEQVSGDSKVKKPLLSKFLEKISVYFAAYYYYYKLKNIAKKQDYSSIIIKDKNICNGKATIKGTRIEPITILYFTLRNNSNIEYIKTNYPYLDEKTIGAALLYAIKTTPFRKVIK